MIDYEDIGNIVKQIRLQRGLTQAQLAKKVGVGVTHISHLESGVGAVSLKVFLSIVNALECSADEILCKEVMGARPIVNSWLTELVQDCDQTEIKIITDTIQALKKTLRKNKRSRMKA